MLQTIEILADHDNQKNKGEQMKRVREVFLHLNKKTIPVLASFRFVDYISLL